MSNLKALAALHCNRKGYGTEAERVEYCDAFALGWNNHGRPDAIDLATASPITAAGYNEGWHRKEKLICQ